MIQNIWELVSFYCMNGHEKPVKMQTVSGPISMFYACPKYNSENRADGERACSNRISLDDAQHIVEEVSALIEESENENIQVCLDGYRWHYKAIEVCILKHTFDKIKIGVLNRRALR